MPKVTFASHSKADDGFLTRGKDKTWLPANKATSYTAAVDVLGGCVAAADLDRSDELHRFFGTRPDTPPHPITRPQFDGALTTFLEVVGRSLPSRLSRLVVNLRHEMLAEGISFDLTTSRLVCLFPVAPADPREAWSNRFCFDSGWRKDGLFLWCGQKTGNGHSHVQRALEDCCGPQCAVLVFRRDSQRSCHVFVGRARGYLPLCDQDVTKARPFQAALMLDTKNPVRTNDTVLEPGWRSPQANKQSVWEMLRTVVHNRYRMQGYSVSSMAGEALLFCCPGRMGAVLRRVRSVQAVKARESELSPFVCRPLPGDFTARGCDGSVILCCRRGLLSSATAAELWSLVQGAAQRSDQRGAAGGLLSDSDIPTGFRRRNHFSMRPSGGTFKKFVGNKVNSAVLGFTSRNKISKWTRQNPGRFQKVLQTVAACSQEYQRILPEQHKAQIKNLDGLDRLAGTAFRTVYVNRNFRTALHQDQNVGRSVLGAMLVVGDFVGGDIQFPEYGVEVCVQSGDLLLFRPDLWHCNKGVDSGSRLSLVCHA